jgi:hypothetical protein
MTANVRNITYIHNHFTLSVYCYSVDLGTVPFQAHDQRFYFQNDPFRSHSSFVNMFGVREVYASHSEHTKWAL